MLERCNDPKAINYEKYGGQGIGVCERWLFFENFFEDMGPRPPNHHLDRIDPTKDYSPDNCRWLHNARMNSNKRNNRLITIDGKTMTLTDWSRELGVSRTTAWRRLEEGKTPAEAFELV